jgi:hypothetical protein
MTQKQLISFFIFHKAKSFLLCNNAGFMIVDEKRGYVISRADAFVFRLRDDDFMIRYYEVRSNDFDAELEKSILCLCFIKLPSRYISISLSQPDLKKYGKSNICSSSFLFSSLNFCFIKDLSVK